MVSLTIFAHIEIVLDVRHVHGIFKVFTKASMIDINVSFSIIEIHV